MGQDDSGRPAPRQADRETSVREHAYEGRDLVQASAQVCIDVANHLIASEG